MIDRSITVRPNKKGNITIPREWLQDSESLSWPVFRAGGDSVIISHGIVTVPKAIPKLTMTVYSPGRLDTYRYEQHDDLAPNDMDMIGLDAHTPGFRADRV
jgi:hypothetical protein